MGALTPNNYVGALQGTTVIARRRSPATPPATPARACPAAEDRRCQDNTPLGPCTCRFCTTHSARVLLKVLCSLGIVPWL